MYFERYILKGILGISGAVGVIQGRIKQYSKQYTELIASNIS
jgi:hypothetical protein